MIYVEKEIEKTENDWEKMVGIINRDWVKERQIKREKDRKINLGRTERGYKLRERKEKEGIRQKRIK